MQTVVMLNVAAPNQKHILRRRWRRRRIKTFYNIDTNVWKQILTRKAKLPFFKRYKNNFLVKKI
jgi:hypothetical protein